MCLNIHESAIFLADSHFNKKNQQFLQFLQKVKSRQIETTQLFFMGDMFDFISGESRYFIKQNSKLIELINELSKDIEIVYLEGNHDYNLKRLFSNIKVVKREKQPLIAKYKNKTVALSHGDNFINWHYNLYCKIIRNTLLLKFLNFIDINYFISLKIEESLLKKNICHKINNFESIVKRRVKFYNSDIIIEGHYHQGDIYEQGNQTYVNIPSLCCSSKYVRLNDYMFEKENLWI